MRTESPSSVKMHASQAKKKGQSLPSVRGRSTKKVKMVEEAVVVQDIGSDSDDVPDSPLINDVGESTAGSATGTEIPEQQPDVSQPPLRRRTGVTINEPTGAPQPTAAPAPPRKGTKKATEPILESSDKNDMDSENVFDMYCALEAPEAPVSKNKSSRRHQGESSKAPPAKKSRTADPPADEPPTNTTPPPSPLEQQTPPAPVGLTPSPPDPTNQTQ
ncbi:lysine-rich arabinogalactan protein 19-like [Humulus lupulus]|uniref:lysine-rich arabinogalactan protein 19-like n=1 Tax=Humulus lupulus TaxID=3486 RepID=UPI002B4163A8|nr:lysine-rich arabinogalactan protein 19-like [Humulus lupulus]